MCLITYSFDKSQRHKHLSILTIKKNFMRHYLLFILFAAISMQGFSQTGSLFFSEYIEGSSSNKYLEIYNGTGADVDLSGYIVKCYPNGVTETTTDATIYSETLSGTLANGDVYIIANSNATIYGGTPDITSTVTYYNGNDAIALMTTSGEYVDIIGCIGESDYWSDGDYSLKDHTLIRKSSVTRGVSTNPSSGFPTLSTEWDLYDKDEVSYLGTYPIVVASVEAPTFSLDEGTFTSTQSVTLFCATEGATIYYTTDGNDPDTNSSIYTGELSITATTTIKAIAYDGTDYSDISEATYTIATLQPVTDLGALRSAYDETTSSSVIYTVSGTVYVSAIDYYGNLYIQDDNGAILVYDSNNTLTTNHSIGDGITNLTGSLTDYYGTMEFVPTEDATNSSTGNTVNATTVTISELNNNWEDYESRLITINSVSFDTSIAGTSFSSTSYTLTDENSNTIPMYPKFSDLSSTTIPATANVSGIAVLYSSSPEICPRDANDIVSTGTTSIESINSENFIYPNPFSDLITVECAQIKKAQLTNLTGELVKSVNATGTNKVTISTSDLSNGIYIIKITKQDGSSSIKKLIKK